MIISNSNLSTLVIETNKDVSNIFKDSHVFEFLNLHEPHSESDLQHYGKAIYEFEPFQILIKKAYFRTLAVFPNEVLPPL